MVGICLDLKKNKNPHLIPRREGKILVQHGQKKRTSESQSSPSPRFFLHFSARVPAEATAAGWCLYHDPLLPACSLCYSSSLGAKTGWRRQFPHVATSKGDYISVLSSGQTDTERLLIGLCSGSPVLGDIQGQGPISRTCSRLA